MNIYSRCDTWAHSTVNTSENVAKFWVQDSQAYASSPGWLLILWFSAASCIFGEQYNPIYSFRVKHLSSFFCLFLFFRFCLSHSIARVYCACKGSECIFHWGIWVLTPPLHRSVFMCFPSYIGEAWSVPLMWFCRFISQWQAVCTTAETGMAVTSQREKRLTVFSRR